MRKSILFVLLVGVPSLSLASNFSREQVAQAVSNLKSVGSTVVCVNTGDGTDANADLLNSTLVEINKLVKARFQDISMNGVGSVINSERVCVIVNAVN